MIILGKILLTLSALFWVSVGVALLFEIPWIGGLGMIFFFATHALLIVGEMVTHRELPHRFHAMKIIWYPIVGLIVLAFFKSFIPR